MKILQLFLAFGILSLSVVGCGSPQTSILNEQSTAIQSKKDSVQEKPVTKQKISLKDAKFKDSDFSKFALTKSEKAYKSDTSFKNTPAKNGPFDNNYLPYRVYNDLERDIRYDNYTDYQFLAARNGNYHFSKCISAYEYAQNIYRASSVEMKRFIKLDVLANAIAVNGYEMSYSEIHNPPFSPGWKYLPTRAADLMPSFGEIYDYNRYNSGVSYIYWDPGRAANFYHSNYARWMGMIMEYGPTDKYKVWDLIHREISTYAGN